MMVGTGWKQEVQEREIQLRSLCLFTNLSNLDNLVVISFYYKV